MPPLADEATRGKPGQFPYNTRMPSLPTRVRIVEMGPRDGLQNEPGEVPAGEWICAIVEREPGSRAGRAIAVKRRKAA